MKPDMCQFTGSRIAASIIFASLALWFMPHASLAADAAGFREGGPIHILKTDGSRFTGRIVRFPGQVDIESEIGFMATIPLDKTFRIRVLDRKMRGRKMLEFHLLDGKVLRGIHCCSIIFEVDLGTYGVQRFDVNEPGRFFVQEVATIPVTRPKPARPEHPNPGGHPAAPATPDETGLAPEKPEPRKFAVIPFPAPITWHEAVQTCRSKGMRIASIHSAAENREVVSLLRRISWPEGTWHGAWIGLSDDAEEGHWTWEDQSPVDFLNFGPGTGEPNGGRSENFAAIELARAGNPDGWWNDAKASEHYPAAVCATNKR